MIVKLVPLLLLLFSCANQPPPTPDWILNSHSTSEYWVGVGSVAINHNDSRENARDQAIREIASQIKIDITSNFKSIITEQNYNVNDYSESLIETRIQNSLPHVEFDKFFTSEDRFYVLAKLSKQKYYDAIALKRQNAVTTAVELIKSAETKLSSQTFILLQEAMQEILSFLDEPILVEYPPNSGIQENLYSLIKMKMVESFNRIKIIPKPSKISIRSGGIDKNLQLQATCIDKRTKKEIVGLPLHVRIEGDENFDTFTSNENGNITFNIPNLVSLNSSQSLLISTNLQSILENSSFSNQFEQNTLGQIQIELLPLKIAVIVDEKQFGNSIMSKHVEPVIKEYFASNLTTKFVDIDESDLEIHVLVTTRKLSDTPNDYRIFQTFADAVFTVIDHKEKTELFSTSINNIKGADFNSNEASSAQAIKKIASKLEKNELPKILKLLTQP
jgi:hypothetical protein